VPDEHEVPRALDTAARGVAERRGAHVAALTAVERVALQVDAQASAADEGLDARDVFAHDVAVARVGIGVGVGVGVCAGVGQRRVVGRARVRAHAAQVRRLDPTLRAATADERVRTAHEEQRGEREELRCVHGCAPTVICP
jgi:hypothetical protein